MTISSDSPSATLVASYGQLGERDAARKALRELLRQRPDIATGAAGGVTRLSAQRAALDAAFELHELFAEAWHGTDAVRAREVAAARAAWRTLRDRLACPARTSPLKPSLRDAVQAVARALSALPVPGMTIGGIAVITNVSQQTRAAADARGRRTPAWT